MYIYTVDREIFTKLYFRVLNFGAFNVHHLASIYIVGRAREKFRAFIIFATQPTGEKFYNGENFPIYGIHMQTAYKVNPHAQM